jgi:hypothetical protein
MDRISYITNNGKLVFKAHNPNNPFHIEDYMTQLNCGNVELTGNIENCKIIIYL